MSSPVSSSSQASSAFSLLDPRIQHWIWELRWTELRDVQEYAIPAILEEQDVIIAAATASGKTEAAFFPVLTRLLGMQNSQATVIYISPLKALINDQWDRLELLCEQLEIMVTPWHGDISSSRKKRFLNKPGGCVLITPESLEALLMNYGHQVNSIFSGLIYCVIDEVHAFMGTERGKQLQSLLHRLEVAVNKKIPRIGLSATLGDMKMAANYLRPENPEGVRIICSGNSSQELKIALYGYKIGKQTDAVTLTAGDIVTDDQYEKQMLTSHDWVARKLFPSLRGNNNLVFPNSRASVEIFSDKLRKMCEDAGVPNEFWPHHGSLSKEIREETERALKEKENPATGICTNTLELGIDIGSVKSVAQVGPPPSVASLRQRIGRSGRKEGEPAILRAFSIENEIDQQSRLSDLLREQLVQSIAMTQLLTKGWCEPIHAKGLHLSTLVQQLLSVIVQYGGLTAGRSWQLFCESGPFSGLTKSEFITLLRGLGEQQVIIQDHTGLLLLGALGEKLVNHYSFYATFKSDEEYRLVHQGKPLGTLPISRAVTLDSYLIFAGRRWRVEAVYEEQKVIVVLPDKGGKAPVFFGGGSRLHDKVREEMREVLGSLEPIPFLDTVSADLLREARFHFRQLMLESKPIIKMGKDVLLFTWKGDNVQDTLALIFKERGHRATNEGLYISVEADSVELIYDLLLEFSEGVLPSEERLADLVENKQQEKWDWLLPVSLLGRNYASLYLELENASRAVKELRSRSD
ncbi:DEAD/DEAH box helicase [Pelosinus sp. sgz500959]|uniref:DEAD/DEAH box helicase n=1 Tax=Pelosinus sp. sgz500959 TaxID=3242472 RepID=UPI00366D6C10